MGRIADQLVMQQALDFLHEDAAKTVYRANSETMGKRLLSMGIVTDYLLSHDIAGRGTLLERVFNEQYEKSDDGIVSVRDKKKVCAKSLQNPNASRCGIPWKERSEGERLQHQHHRDH